MCRSSQAFDTFHTIHNFSDPNSISPIFDDDLPPGRRKAIQSGEALEFSHSLDAQIGGQLEAGFLLVGFYEDWWTDDATPLNRLCPTSIATRALRPA